MVLTDFFSSEPSIDKQTDLNSKKDILLKERYLLTGLNERNEPAFNIKAMWWFSSIY